MSERNGAAPHVCPQCGEPSYLGFDMPARCTAKGCIFYDADLWVEWVMLIDDTGDPADSEPDFFLDEDDDTQPNFLLPTVKLYPSTKGGGINVSTPNDPALDAWGALFNVTRLFGEDDYDYMKRLLDLWNPAGQP